MYILFIFYYSSLISQLMLFSSFLNFSGTESSAKQLKYINLKGLGHAILGNFVSFC